MKYGIDPTSPHVHLGHTVPLRILRLFQDAGHKAQIIIGDFTASLGDPSGRDEMRRGMSLEDARKNAKKYLAQIGKVIDTSPAKCEVYLNSGWLEKFDLRWVLEKLKSFTVQQITNRDDFKKRIGANQPVHLSELMYPILQGQDSVELGSDIELGGNEQMFTLLLAREMQKEAGQKPQVCITLPLLVGLDGKQKMGKSLGNYVGVEEDPFEMFSKVMSIPDNIMPDWFRFLTNVGKVWEQTCLEDPMNAKLFLANRVTASMHGDEAASNAGLEWTKRFSKREQPEEIPEVGVVLDEMTLTHLVWSLSFAKSKNDARRLIVQGAISVDGTRLKDPQGHITPAKGMVVKCGRHYVKVKELENAKEGTEAG